MRAESVGGSMLVSDAAPSVTHILADQAARGDLEAFDQLVAMHESKVLNISYRVVGNPTDAEDVAQEAFLKAYRALPVLRDRSQFTPWVYRIAINTARDFLRRQRHREEVALEEALTSTHGDVTARAVEQSQMSAVIHRILGGLPERHRVVLVLRDIQGLSYEELAQTLGCTVSSIKNRLHRARRVFRDRLEPYLDESEEAMGDG